MRTLGAFVVAVLLSSILLGFGPERVARVESRRVLAPAGTFLRGSDSAAIRRAVALCRRTHRVGGALGVCDAELFAPEIPFGAVYVPAFEIDRTEVTRAEYARCEQAGACATPRLGAGDDRIGRPEHPVVGVSAYDAEDYCRFVGGRLPTDDEWEKAARGARDARTFPWGEVFDVRLANHGAEDGELAVRDGHRYLAPVGSFSEGASPYGLVDVAGNVWEWTSSAFTPGPRTARLDASNGARSIRGGSYRSTPLMLRVAYRVGFPAADYAADVGFRCAYDVRR